MKPFLCSIMLLFICTYAHATIFRLGGSGSPTPGYDFGYTDFNTAQNAASPGDTIQVYQQLAAQQANYTVNKRLVIIGFGHSLNINSGLQVQNKMDSSYNYCSVTFQQGSAGSFIAGLNISQCEIWDSNITVTRCRFRGGLQQTYWSPCYGGSNLVTSTGGQLRLIVNNVGNFNLPNITINGCYFDGPSDLNTPCIRVDDYYNSWGWAWWIGGGWGYNPFNAALTNLNISNNVFNSWVNLNGVVSGHVNGIFSNNIINLNTAHLYDEYQWNSNICTQGSFYNSSAFKVSNFDYFLIKNNIFNTGDTVTCPLNAGSSVIQNNVFSTAASYACVSLAGGNNVFHANMNQVFGPAWNNGNVLNDNQLALASGSVAANAGVKGNNTPTPCGIFGGETGETYKLSGIPPVPAIYQLSTPGPDATTNPYNITISVRSNN